MEKKRIEKFKETVVEARQELLKSIAQTQEERARHATLLRP